MCTQKPPYDYSEQLYQRYREAFNNYINDKVSHVLSVRAVHSFQRTYASCLDYCRFYRHCESIEMRYY